MPLPQHEEIIWKPVILYHQTPGMWSFIREWVPTEGPWQMMEAYQIKEAQNGVRKMAKRDGWSSTWSIPHEVMEHFMAEIWMHWCDSTIASSTTTTNDSWVQWCTGTDNSGRDMTGSATTNGTASGTVWQSWVGPVDPPEVDEQVRADWEKEAEARKERDEEARKKREQANKQATELLRSQLDEEQLADYDLNGGFTVVANKKKYRIRGAETLELDKDDKKVASFCIHASWREPIPMPDQMLAKKLMLDANPKEFLRVANRTPRR